MKIDTVIVRESWSNLENIIKENIPDIPVKDLSIKYDNGIVLSGRYPYKIDIRFSITIGNVGLKEENIELYISDISVYIKLPGIVKDIIINSILRKYEGKILYDNNVLVVTGSLLKEMIPIEDYKITSLTAVKDYIEVELSSIKVSTGTISDDFKSIAYNVDLEIGDFDETKALDYYSKVRKKLTNYVNGSVPQKFRPAVPYMLMIPDILIMFLKLLRDDRIAGRDRAFVTAGIMYLVSPIDMLPDYVLPIGVIDDLVALFFILYKLTLSVPGDALEESFSGSTSIVGFVKRNFENVKSMLPGVMYEKLVTTLNSIADRVDKK